MPSSDFVKKFFNERAVQFKDSIQTLDWGSKRTQWIRFHVLSEIGNLNGCSILDIGCGFADFFDFLQERGIEIGKYTGLEISDKIFEMTRAMRPELDIRKLDILEEDVEPYDYVFGSGIHYLKTRDNYKRTGSLLRKMYKICNKGVATNMISFNAHSDQLAKHVFAYDSATVLKIAKEISPYSILRHDYLPQDFSIYLYKDDWAERNSGVSSTLRKDV